MWSPRASLQMLQNVVCLRSVRSIVGVAVTVPSIISSSCRMLGLVISCMVPLSQLLASQVV
eukprot:3481248-Pyramimonas_sp.AAC.1